jgi:peptide subunit release factor 1 (eRF1)
LQAVIVNIVDVSYGGENGFNQVRLSAVRTKARSGF